MKKNEDFKYITDVNYLLTLLYSLYDIKNYIKL